MKKLLIALMLCGAVTLEASNYKSIVSSHSTVVMDVYSDGCPPCNQLAPIFQAVERQYGQSHKFVKVNGRQDSSIVSELNIRGFPTVIFFKNGQEVGRQTGFVNHDQLVNLVNRYLK